MRFLVVCKTEKNGACRPSFAPFRDRSEAVSFMQQESEKQIRLIPNPVTQQSSDKIVVTNPATKESWSWILLRS